MECPVTADNISWALVLMSILCLWFVISLRLAEEKADLLKQCEERVSAKAEETEHIKLQLEEAQQELLLTKNQVCFS